MMHRERVLKVVLVLLGLLFSGGWPTFVDAMITEAAPALLPLQSWAPRTLP